MSGSGRKTLPVVREWSRDPPKCPGVFRKPSRMFESGRKALLDVREALSDVQKWTGDTFGCPGMVEKPSRIPGSGLEALPDVWQW